MDIIELAREAGLQVLLDARIGSQTYHSVSGSLPALQRFADAVEATLREHSPHPRNPLPSQRARSARHAAATRFRKRAPNCPDLRERAAEIASTHRAVPARHRSSR